MKEPHFIRIKRGARLHIQVLDPGGISGYKRGGIGLALKRPFVEVIVSKVPMHRKGFVEDKLYLNELEHINGLSKSSNLNVYIKSEIPKHVGLGSGSICRILIRQAVIALSKGGGCIEMSTLTGVGKYAVMNGGFVVASTVPKDSPTPSQFFKGVAKTYTEPNIIGSYKFPPTWKIVLCIPKNISIFKGLSGEDESRYYSNLKSPSQDETYQINFEVLSRLIPSIQYGNYDQFCKSMNVLVSIGWKPEEKKTNYIFWERTSRALLSQGAKFVGLSSGGPTTYAIFDESRYSLKIMKHKLDAILHNISSIIITDADNMGITLKI